MSESKFTINEMDNSIKAALENAPEEGVTLAELKEMSGLDIKPAHMTHAIKAGYAHKLDEKRVIYKDSTKEVSTFIFVNDTIATLKDGTPANYSDLAKSILAVAPEMGEFTIAELSDKVGSKVAPGVITSLVKKGNLSKAGTREVPCKVKSSVTVYVK